MITPDPVLFSLQLYGSKPIVITPWTFFGLVGNVLFSTRVLIQWIASERQKKSIAPVTFWWTSLAATLIMIGYSAQRAELAFLLGYSVNVVPYTRNLMLIYSLRRLWHVLSYIASAAIFGGALILFRYMQTPLIHSHWFYLGLVGVIVWNIRFIPQWIYSERKGQSVFPLWFWIWSLIGQMLCLLYSLILHDLVFILGFLFNGIPIIRNIMLSKRHVASGEPESH